LNILYLIGNGFDLNLGLNTKLSHVIENIIDEETDNSEILKLKEILIKNKDLWWSDFELQLGQHTKEFNPKTIDAYDNQYNYFVKKIKYLFEKQERRINYNKDNNFLIAKTFMKQIITFYNYLPDTNKEIVLNTMKNIYNDDNIYYDFITFNYTSVLDNFVKCTKDIFKNNNSTPMPIISMKAVFHILRKIIHIHGTLEDGLILGVDNIEQIANKRLSKINFFIPKIIKQETIKALGRNTTVEAMELIDNSNIIIAFGLSIGVTDKYWWNYIVNWLMKDNDRQFILFIYNDKIDTALNLTKLNTKEKAKTRLFSVLNKSIQKKYNNYKDRIHFIFEQKNMFKIEDIFYSTRKDTYINNGSSNRFNLSHTLNNLVPNIGISSKAVKIMTPDVIKKFDDFFKKLP